MIGAVNSENALANLVFKAQFFSNFLLFEVATHAHVSVCAVHDQIQSGSMTNNTRISRLQGPALKSIFVICHSFWEPAFGITSRSSTILRGA